MSRKKIVIISIFAFVFLLFAVFVFFRIRDNLSAKDKRAPQSQSVEVTTPVLGSITRKLSFTGDILSVQQANIFSRVNGNIERIYVDIGDYVSKGKTLATIDRSTYQQTVKQTEAVFNQAKAQVENNEVNYLRTKQLFDKGLSSQGDLDNAETVLKVSIAQMEAAGAGYQNARIQIGYCNITAPFSGYITKRFLDAGALVSSGTSNSIFMLSDISNLKIMVNVLEKDISSLDYIKTANIRTDAYPDEVFPGKFKKISQAVDPGTRTMPAEISIDNKDKLLKPGMFARVEVVLEEHNDVLILPEQCVLKDDTGTFVYSVTDDLTAVKKYVEIGINSDNKTEIKSGIGDTEKIVSTGQELLKDKMKVKIVK